MDKKKIKKLIDWWKVEENHQFIIDCDEDFFIPLMEAFGDDVEAILKYLDKMDVVDLKLIAGVFEDIYKKWTTDAVWDELEKLESKIKDVK
ncbi:MAG: hypothetical protein Q4B26_07940 [Eubacteriales bacterium]|nr:hypothetical protein [Eubacteriales bacterium]